MAIQEVKVSEVSGIGGVGKTLKMEHPSFALISASRVTGGMNLNGSDFKSNTFITLKIKKSHIDYHLSREWHHEDQELIEVCMTEAQWATFISSLNAGSGVPATITFLQGERIPSLPEPKPREENFSKDLNDNFEKAFEKLKELQVQVQSSGLSKKKVEEFERTIAAIKSSISGSTKFVADSFDEHMEKTVERAKCEVLAYMTHQSSRIGFTGEQPLIIEDNSNV